MKKKLNLYPHNLDGYKNVKNAYNNGKRVVGIVHATGTGKSYIFLQLCLDNPDTKTLYIAPSNAVIEHIKEVINECGLSLENDFPNLKFCTYQSLTTMSDEELKNLDIELLCLDEFHHIGAPVWGEKVNTIVNTHPNMKVFGMTAYTIRDRGTSYERDMAKPNGNELFSDNIVSTYDLVDAMCDGVLPIPNYKSAYLRLDEELLKLEQQLTGKKGCEEYLNLIKSCKHQLDKATTAKDLILENLQSNDKCIYFCPLGDGLIMGNDYILGTNDIYEIQKRIGMLASRVNKHTILFETTSDLSEYGKINRDHFYNDTDFWNNDISDVLRIMFAKNQYNEGVHAPGVNKVFMARETGSDIVYFEQLGRALSVKGNIVELTKQYEEKTIEELIGIASKHGIDISKCESREQIIERLLAPTIIDLAGNIEFIKELKDNLLGRIKEREEKGIPTKITRKLVEVAFNIDVKNEEIYEILQEIKNNLVHPWAEMYDYARIYYEKNGNLEVPFSFKTNDGYTYDESGTISLGQWIRNQRIRTNSESERGKLLTKIGMIWEVRKINRIPWEEMYNYARIYYKYNGDLEVQRKFKTNDGYTYDESGTIPLGQWIFDQRIRTNPESERGRLLTEIGMRWENKSMSWEEMYDYARIYYEHNGNLEVQGKFKTNDGYTYDENGTIPLGQWIFDQRKRTNLESERGRLLTEIGMRWENKINIISWEEMYNYASIYFEHIGNLEVPYKFKTNDGYTYDENGTIPLGQWIKSQRVRINPESERGRLLTKIGMVWSIKKNKDEISQLCIQYNINIKKNKNILKHISIQELQSKIEFLIENNIPITNENGILIDIFSMSNIDMEEKYHISLEELINNYYFKNKGKGV